MARSRHYVYRLGLALGALLLLPGAKSGCGSEEANTTFSSPVQAVTTLLAHDDGTVHAEVVLISTADLKATFIDDAKNVQLRVPAGALIPLSLSSPGHYTAESTTDPKLAYTAGATYQFTFDLDNETEAKKVAGGNFSAVADAPDDPVSLSFTKEPAFAGDVSTITWSPAERFALITVTDPDGAVVYQNFDFKEPKFDGSKWARLKKGGTMDLGVDVFAKAGRYKVRLCAVDKVSDFDTKLSAELGALSGFLIGRCAQEQVLDVSR